MKIPETLEEIKMLLGKTIAREDVIVSVQAFSIGQSGTVYVHANFKDIGWTFLNPNGTLCGKWEIL